MLARGRRGARGGASGQARDAGDHAQILAAVKGQHQRQARRDWRCAARTTASAPASDRRPRLVDAAPGCRRRPPPRGTRWRCRPRSAAGRPRTSKTSALSSTRASALAPGLRRPRGERAVEIRGVRTSCALVEARRARRCRTAECTRSCRPASRPRAGHAARRPRGCGDGHRHGQEHGAFIAEIQQRPDGELFGRGPVDVAGAEARRQGPREVSRQPGVAGILPIGVPVRDVLELEAQPTRSCRARCPRAHAPAVRRAPVRSARRWRPMQRGGQRDAAAASQADTDLALARMTI